MKFLSLDIARKTGWAYFDGENITQSGVEDWESKLMNSHDMRFERFYTWLCSFFKNNETNVVFFEQPMGHTSGHNTSLRYGYIGVLRQCAARHGISQEGYAPGTIKAHLVKGNASKEEMMDAVSKRGFKFSDDNEADAIALALLVKEKKYEGTIHFEKSTKTERKTTCK